MLNVFTHLSQTARTIMKNKQGIKQQMEVHKIESPSIFCIKPTKLIGLKFKFYEC